MVFRSLRHPRTGPAFHVPVSAHGVVIRERIRKAFEKLRASDPTREFGTIVKNIFSSYAFGTTLPSTVTCAPTRQWRSIVWLHRSHWTWRTERSDLQIQKGFQDGRAGRTSRWPA